MNTAGGEIRGSASEEPSVSLVVRVVRGRAAAAESRFTGSFVIGRSRECDLQVTDGSVSRRHLRISLADGRCILQDLASANGTFLNGVRVSETVIDEKADVELGKGGALLSLTVEREATPASEDDMAEPEGCGAETRIIRRYFSDTPDDAAGEQTMMFRRAFRRAQKRNSRRYLALISTVLLLLLAAGVIICRQTQKIGRLRATAESIFYTARSLGLQIAKLEEIVSINGDPRQAEELRLKRLQLREMEGEYDGFVRELGVYDRASEDERIILRVARKFGECDASAPRGFVEEVRRHIRAWKTSGNLGTALERAKRMDYERWIVRILKDNEISPQFFFLALQESGFDERAVGPETRHGYAKGMWQFMSETAARYGLRTGPLRNQGAYDPLDERFDFIKSTVAAAKYIKDISNSEAQASGLLVMASYNWGEDSVIPLIRKMPENPRQRNFWRLLEQRSIPQETYDYVFYIVSAAAICENPRLFGFDSLACPIIESAWPEGENRNDPSHTSALTKDK